MRSLIFVYRQINFIPHVHSSIQQSLSLLPVASRIRNPVQKLSCGNVVASGADMKKVVPFSALKSHLLMYGVQPANYVVIKFVHGLFLGCTHHNHIYLGAAVTDSRESPPGHSHHAIILLQIAYQSPCWVEKAAQQG